MPFGLLIARFGWKGIARYRHMNRVGEHVTGTVTGLRWASKNNSRFCFPVLAFRTLDGRDIQAESKVGRTRPTAQPGEQVPIIYDPSDPAKAEINTATARGLRSLAFSFLLGVAIICLPFFWSALGRGLNTTAGKVVFSLIWVAAGSVILCQALRLNRVGQRVTGTVVKHRWQNSRDGSVCGLTVLFQTLDGQVIRTGTRISSNRGNPEPGEQVLVVYDPRDPFKAELASRFRMTLAFSLLLILVGLAILCYALLDLRPARFTPCPMPRRPRRCGELRRAPSSRRPLPRRRCRSSRRRTSPGGAGSGGPGRPASGSHG
ncbi:MAG: DUF3592 domain-containing protein [Nocardiopsaceae bacterium]|nr:DUF3592 domain-containing protein [Nocardiopsaceae bacterium]